MTRHRKLAHATNFLFYLCDPHPPSQCGNCKNTNTFSRQMLAKYTDLSIYDQQVLDSIPDLLNH